VALFLEVARHLLSKIFTPDQGTTHQLYVYVAWLSRATASQHRHMTYMNCCIYRIVPPDEGDRGSTVIKVLCYKSEGRWFDSIWCHWNFSLT